MRSSYLSPVLSDADLLDRLRSGDPESYAELYRRHHLMAVRTAVRVGVARADADDVVAEAYARVLRAVRGGRGPTTNFPGYLSTAVTRLAWSFLEQSARCHPTEDVELLDGRVLAELPDALGDSPVGAALAALPVGARRLLWRLEVHGDTVGDIAREQGSTPNSVSAAAFRARRRLRLEYLRRTGPA